MRVIHTIRKQINPYFGCLVNGLKLRGIEAEHGYLSILGSLFGRRYDIVHVHFASDSLLQFLDEFARLVWHRLLGCRIIKTCHNVRPHSSINPRLAYWFERIIGRLADHMIFFTDGQRKEFASYYRLSPASWSVICHPYPDCYPNTMKRATARSALGLSDDDFVYLIFGGVRANKNYDRVIESFRLSHGDNAKLLVAISAHAVNPTETAAFERCRDLLSRPNPNIVAHVGLIPDHEVQRYFNAADVLLVPFTDNTSSATFMMSLAFCIPFVAVENAFNRHVLPDTCGIYIRSLDELPYAMNRIKGCDLRSMRHEIDCRRAKYGWDTVVSEHVQSYSSVLRPTQRHALARLPQEH
jgi:beta-1,4-mannosyltransferase